MTTWRKKALGCFLTGGLVLASYGVARADGHCHNIRGKGVGVDSGTGSTTADILGGGVLHGTTTATFSIVGGTAPVFDIAGAISFSANLGGVTADVSGTFDVSTGEFNVVAIIRSGSDRFADATGTLNITGIEDFATGKFAEDITGSVCHSFTDN